LQAVVQNLNIQFAEMMRLRGHRHRILNEPGTTINLASDRKAISRGDFISEIQGLLKITQGRNYPACSTHLLLEISLRAIPAVEKIGIGAYKDHMACSQVFCHPAAFTPFRGKHY